MTTKTLLATTAAVALCAQAASAQDITLQFWDNQQTESGLSQFQQEAVDRFMAENPDIAVEVTTIPYPEYQQRLLTAVQGGKISIDVPITEECATCSGSGAAPGSSVKTCSECGGSGQVSFGQSGFAVKRPCPACLGQGRIPEKPCPACSGRGSLRQARKVQVTVPKGVDTGSKLKLSGQGERGAGGGPPGDLILTFKVKEHRFFERDGLNIHVTVPINIVQAALGSKIKVRTVSGARVVLRIPPGTQPGTRFRIRGQGVEKGERVGDQIVEVKVEVPETLDADSRKALEMFGSTAALRH